MKVIVTGASGFIGSRLVQELLKRGIHTIPVSRKPINFPNSFIVDNYYDTPDGDILIHLAENSNRYSVNKIGRPYLIEMKNLIDHLISKDYQRIVYASSVSVYNDQLKDLLKPHDPVDIRDTYSQSKINCEHIIKKTNGVIARISNLYGHGMSENNVISTIIKQIHSGKIDILDDKPIRDFLWIEDAVNALIKIALGRATGIFNVASGEAVSINELIAKILNKSGIDKKVKILVSKPNKIVSIIKPDILDTFTSFGWKPKMKLENGINELLNKGIIR